MKPTEAQIKEFWLKSGLREGTHGWLYHPDNPTMPIYPLINLNNLFKYAPESIVGVCFRLYPGGCECELTYITEAGFNTVKSWVKKKSNDIKESWKLTALALFWTIYEVIKEKETTTK